MIQISDKAQTYFAHLLAQQDEPDLGLRLKVLNPGTPRADCEILFCSQAEAGKDDQTLHYDGFKMFLAAGSNEWLEEAEIDFEDTATGGQLTVKAPHIKGHAPSGDAPLAERVAWVIDTEINTMVASHGGRVSLQEITPAGEAVLQFGGGCHGCSMVDVTLKIGVEKTLLSQFSELVGVLDATDHSTGENPYMS